MTRNVCITSVDGQTGFLVSELLLTNPLFSSKLSSLTGLALDPSSTKATELASLGATILPLPTTTSDSSDSSDSSDPPLLSTLRNTPIDTLCLIPPSHPDKLAFTKSLITTAKESGTVRNILLLSSAGCDYAERDSQPRLREFIDLETMVLSTKGDTSTELGHSPCVIRAGFYAENLLLYSQQAREEGRLPLPVGKGGKFAPVALGDVAQVAAHVLSGKGPHGFDDRHRGQMMVVTGPMLCAGEELATAASEALGKKLVFEDISEEEAKRVLKEQDIDESEKEYILEYYSLVREGKTNYIATTAFHDVTGDHPTDPEKFFRMYADELRPKKKVKLSNDSAEESAPTPKKKAKHSDS